MASTQGIFDQLVEAGSIAIKTDSLRSHDSLRTRLVKLYSTHKKLLDSIGADDGSGALSVSGEFDPVTGISKFFIRVAKKAFGKPRVDYEVISVDDEGVSANG